MRGMCIGLVLVIDGHFGIRKGKRLGQERAFPPLAAFLRHLLRGERRHRGSHLPLCLALKAEIQAQCLVFPGEAATHRRRIERLHLLHQIEPVEPVLGQVAAVRRRRWELDREVLSVCLERVLPTCVNRGDPCCPACILGWGWPLPPDRFLVPSPLLSSRFPNAGIE